MFYNLCVVYLLLHSQAQLNGLPPLVVPKRLVHRGWRKSEGEGEGEGGKLNQTDQQKSIAKDTVNLLEVGETCHMQCVFQPQN